MELRTTMGTLPPDWAIPALDARNEAWFTSGTLAVQRCVECDTLQHPPEEICHSCGAMTFTTQVMAPRGTVHSFTVVHYAVNRGLAESVPYAVVLVNLDDAPEIRIVGNLPEVAAEEIRIGMPVVAFWEEKVAEDGTVVRLAQWAPA